ncbi:adenylate/guanylate cyclase domain-containing protein [Ensifer sp. 2YAB10]|uniref:adenylate/guanylate cyclase domain-containing protein n=1 Tax=Ensifer TaxID=106591 RepID=UPI000DE34B39|nr:MULTISPECIES: adenylate/guanylate cyclase domain-containing protein [Ensifer]MBK5565319.1 tetratricopeptide repeat protein [Ensifer sp. SSB1]MBZ7920502.1 adenylate/guanylate cyclase domain-containing protein [Ensifer adhaerens]UAX92982.1 adenylate/guanylate cyclase domain-containing protein [Ensifer adhaerens]UAY00617.1 adenylate/guanylate cyclase domain-containing protein [Ensifer adhaerens]UAY07998.1 adenylate/guanylate cyclase domain-containing protein [Ensifer adhaerens]
MANESIMRRLAAILAADVVGYSRLMERDEKNTYRQLMARWKEVLEPLVATHRGRVFKTTGDGVLVEFSSAVNAVECAAALQRAMTAANRDVPAEQAIVLRVGVNMGDIMVADSDLYGDGVNVAARIEALARPGGVAISDGVHEYVQGRIDLDFIDSGHHEVKNIERPVHIWSWSPDEYADVPVRVVPEAPPQIPSRPSIAVLPFDNMSGDPEQGYFADGITEDIITDLSKVSGLFVIARNSSFAYKGKSPDIRQVSRDLGVRYVLEGSVRRAANRIRINAQMIDGTTGGHLWAERYDRGIEDIFEVQDEVTRTIVTALKVKLTAGEEERRESRNKVDPQAYDMLVRSRQAILRFEAASSADARNMLQRAIAIDPGLAAAYASLSIIALTDYINRWNGGTVDNVARALELAQKAVDIDDNEPHGYHALSLALCWQRSFDEAERAAQRVIELDPNSASGHTALGTIRDFQGQFEAALPFYTRAHRLDPQFDLSLHFLGRTLLNLGRFDEAEIAFKRRLTLAPRSDMTRFYLACLYGRTGRHEDARRYWHEVFEVNPDFSIEHLKRAMPYRDPGVLGRLADGLRDAGISL